MKEKDIHRLIEMQDLQKKQALKAKLDARLAAFPAPAPCADAPKKRRSVFTWVTACVCAVCLAIALPFLLTDGKTDDERFSYTENQFKITVLDVTLKEYGQQHNRPLLYLDWYDMEEIEITTLQKTPHDGRNAFYMQEEYLNGEIYDEVYVTITSEDTYVDLLENNWNAPYIDNVQGVKVHWWYDTANSYGAFRYKGYKYYIAAWDVPEHDTVLHIVEMMLSSDR